MDTNADVVIKMNTNVDVLRSEEDVYVCSNFACLSVLQTRHFERDNIYAGADSHCVNFSRNR